MKLCRYCNQPMEEVDVTDYLNPVWADGSHDPIPAYHCTNKNCIEQPYFFRYKDVIEPDRASGYSISLGGHEKTEVFRRWFCPYCDNPVEILDSVYYIWNCPNCKELASQGVTFRYYPIIKSEGDEIVYDDDAEMVDERFCGTHWDPYAPPRSDEEDD